MHQPNRRNILQAGGIIGAVSGATGRTIARAEDVNYTAPPRHDLPGFVRLIANENPYGPGPKARNAMLNSFDAAHRYAIRTRMSLETLIAKHEEVTTDHIVIGSGSSEVLAMAAIAYGQSGGTVLTAKPTFEMLQPYAKKTGAQIKSIPLDTTFTHDLNAMAGAIDDQTALIYICNPNNPTGTLLKAEQLRDFCRSAPPSVIIIIDEAYLELTHDPAGNSMIDLVRDGLNVIVTRTFSKIHGMAGLRIGYGIAPPEISKKLVQFRTTTPNTIGLHGAMASYIDFDFQTFSKQKINHGKQMVYDICNELNRPYIQSAGNFVCLDTGMPSNDFSKKMREQNILLRGIDEYKHYVRVSIGTIDNMAKFQDAMRLILKN